jgi:hypothetical protein
VTDTTKSASATIAITASGVTASSFSFYLSGLEVQNQQQEGPNFYALAGSVVIDSNGNVLFGEQDYNDANGNTSPEPSGDKITGGTLTWVDAATGQGTLSLITNNTALGVSRTETLGVQFVNADHALIVQFDGTATSSGSMDLQTLPSTLNGGYSFIISGEGSDSGTVAIGGVFSITGTALNGVFDIDDSAAPAVVMDTAFSGTISATDNLGRGTITGTAIATTFAYYIVGPEAIRIIDVDATDSGVGSAFGQGTGTFSNASLGSSVFGVESNSWQGPFYAAAGMFTADSAAGTFTGIADDNEQGTAISSVAISGTYSIASNGYGSLTIPPVSGVGQLGDVSALGIYMTDPNLNLLDPNNLSGFPGGGALIADLDWIVVGTGILIPQTSTASFGGNYAFGAQVDNGLNESSFGWEFDFVGQGPVSSLALDGTGLVSDPFFALDSGASPPSTYKGVTFTGTAVVDTNNPGRYTLPLVVTTGVGSPLDSSVIIYQASGGQLLWMSEDANDLFLGSLQQQGPLTGLPVPEAKKAAAKTKANQKP